MGREIADIQKRYRVALVEGDAATASRLIDRAVMRKLAPGRIYLEILVPAQVELGELWHAGRLSVAEEHLATEITLQQMERLRQRLSKAAPLDARALVTSVEGDPHTVGARMLADLLLLDGWTVDYLGPGTPTRDLAELVRRRQPDLVALSITLPDCLEAAARAVQALRHVTPPPRIVVGGAAIGSHPNAAAAMGADATAADALAGLREARRLLTTSAPRSPDESYFAALGRRLQNLRTARGLTQQQLAEAADLDRTYISGLEHGKENPTIGVLLRLAEALQVSLKRLITAGTDDDPL